MKRFDVLSSETKVLGRRFLEASAGTGKTFTIEHLVVRFMVEEKLNLDQILVATFTKAAARELKMRIRTQLEKKGLQKELLVFDQAQIYTIHGFCQRMLQEFAFEAGIGFDLNEWTKKDERLAIDMFLREKIDKSRYSAAQVGFLMKHFSQDIRKLTHVILNGKKRNQTELHFGQWLEIFNQKIRSIPSFSVTEEYEKIFKHFKGIKETFLAQALFLEHILKKREVTEVEFDQLLEQRPYFLKMLEGSNRKVRAPDFTLHFGLEILQKEILPIIEEASCNAKILKRLTTDWELEREKISQEKELFSPDEILTRMQKCLTLPHFVSKVRSKYKAVIVDEFQDTDPIQWEIFETLFLHDDLKAFYLVGDPKQSIYAFRSADVYTYMKAAAALGPDSKAHLDTNYRSTSGLIDALNRLFCNAPWIDLPALKTMLPVQPVKASKEGEGTVHFFIAEGRLGRGKTWPSLDLEEQYFFPFIAQEITEPNQTAILVKDRYQAHRVQKYLQKWNIPSSLTRGGSLANSLALLALKEIVEAVFDPKFIKKALLGVIIGFGIDDLSDETVFAATEIFAEFRKALFERGFATFYALFLKSEWKGQTVLEKLVSQRDLTVYHDLNVIAEKAISQKDPQGILEYFNEMKDWETDDRISGETFGVQIMTTHASKGLEFDTVFALGMASRTKDSDEPDDVVRELDAEKMRQLYVALTRAKTRVYIPIAKDLDNKPIPMGTASPIELFLERVAPDLSQFPKTLLNETVFHLQMRKNDPLLVHPPFVKPPLKLKLLLSFSALSQKSLYRVSPPKDILPAGSETGVIIHRILEKALNSPVDIAQEIAGTHLQEWEAQVREMIDHTLNLPILDFSRERMFQELEFVFPTKDGLCKGFIDLCFEKEGKYYLVDWKTNWLENYTEESLEKSMHEHDYFLQASIYAEALKRYLKLYDPRPFEECFGGAYYIFVRGPAVYHFIPKQLETLKNL